MARQQLRVIRLAAALAASWSGLMLAGAAGAVDLRDWGRKFPTSERFVVLPQFGNEAVLDKETQLVWQRSPSPGTAIWSGAVNHCFLRVQGGRLGWRLPTVPEFLSLIVWPDAPFGSPALPTGHPFTNVPNGLFWTSTLPRDPSGQPQTRAFAASINFGGSTLFVVPLAQHRFRWCVRGGGDLPE
jgi:hypothetical protein